MEEGDEDLDENNFNVLNDKENNLEYTPPSQQYHSPNPSPRNTPGDKWMNSFASSDEQTPIDQTLLLSSSSNNILPETTRRSFDFPSSSSSSSHHQPYHHQTHHHQNQHQNH